MFNANLIDLSTGRFDSSLFRFPEAGEVGNLAMTPLSGPKFFNFDFNLIKRTHVTEDVNVEFRADMFNVLNRTNFNIGVNQNVDSTNFGIINNAFAARIIQLALRLNF